MFKKIVSLLLAFLCVIALAGCNKEDEPQKGDETQGMGNKSIVLTDEFSFVARSDNDKLADITLTKISEIDGQYVMEGDGYFYVDATAPCFELGAATTDERENIARLAADVSESEYASNTAGVTLRFITNASHIKIWSNISRKYKSNTTVERGSYGFDLYVGTGTDRVQSTGYLQTLTKETLNDAVELPSGTKEVLIYLPQLANLEDLRIGFANQSAGVALPTQRDHAPVVFYGSGITQGLSTSRSGNAYANIVTRMLNTDCINFGMIDGAHGEAAVADYIAGLGDISAFVMEFDHGATLDELKENHYNFYKTVRDAHPGIPIIIMNDPVLSDADRRERGERVAVINETYEKAVAAGDKAIWLLDGEDIFPTDDLLDFYTADLETLNNTGHYYLATCIYDLLNSAFTPDDEKTGVEREVGFKDCFEYELYSCDDKIMDRDYVSVASVDAENVKTESDGISYLLISTPQLELGGLIDPEDNMGEFYRVPYEKKNEFLGELLESAYYSHLLNHTSGGTIRFCTNADRIVVKAALENVEKGTHGSFMGFAGLEVYVGTGNDRVYCAERGQTLVGNNFTETVMLPEGYKEVMITLPNYSGIRSISIGLPTDAMIAEPTERDYEPILFYGTSITQGACASRSSLGFANTSARLLNTDLVHLGFSGSARGEQIMADYIASMANELSAFVMNYDANSSEAEMRERCYPFYKTVRDANPDLPIFLMSCPYFNDVRPSFREDCYQIMKDTYDRAVSEGDTNVYLIDCRDLFPEELTTIRDIGVVDSCHLTDTGMYYVSRELYKILSEVLAK